MTTEPVTSIGKKLGRTAVDVGTIGLSFVFCTAACDVGPATAGAVAAAVALPLVYSMTGIMFRHFLTVPDDAFSVRFVEKTGLQITAAALKNIFTNAKTAMVATSILGAVGLGVGFANASFRESVLEQQKYNQMMVTLPVLPLDTIIKKVETKASDLCVNRNGDKISGGREILYKYNGAQYKIICP